MGAPVAQVLSGIRIDVVHHPHDFLLCQVIEVLYKFYKYNKIGQSFNVKEEIYG